MYVPRYVCILYTVCCLNARVVPAVSLVVARAGREPSGSLCFVDGWGWMKVSEGGHIDLEGVAIVAYC